MKLLVMCCLAVVFATAVSAHKQRSTPRRNFLFYIKEEIGRVCVEVDSVKQQIQECCNRAGCTYEGKPYSHDAVFPAADGCNLCVCKSGSVDCTNITNCDEDTGDTGGSTYHYKDVIAQAFCAGQIPPGYEGSLVSAVRRDCSNATPGAAPPCEDICAAGSQFAMDISDRFPGEGLNDFLCFGGMWMWLDHPILAPNPGPGQTDAGLLNLVTISYGPETACLYAANECGPNYCCCGAVHHFNGG